MRRALFVLPLLLLVSACHGRSPSAPSGAAAEGATIRGAISGSGSGGSLRPSALASGATTVAVAGTNLVANLDSRNRFALTGVRPGPVTLRFSGPTLSGEISLAPVSATETIELTLSLESSSLSVESERRSLGREQQLEGLIDALPAAPAGALVVAGQLVITAADTRFYAGETTAAFADLEVGQRVHVKGQMGDLALAALVVMIQNAGADEPDEPDQEDEPDAEDDESEGQQTSASIEGRLMALSGADLMVGTTTVHTDGLTTVRRKGAVLDLTALSLGMTLHVVGNRQTDGSITARMIQIKDDETGGAFEITGSMGSVKGTCPAALQFKINGYDIVTDSGTTFTPACTTFKSGTHATVKGVVQADGSILATDVTK